MLEIGPIGGIVTLRGGVVKILMFIVLLDYIF